MQDPSSHGPSHGPGAVPSPASRYDHAGFAPPISMHDIFRRLIAEEVRNGRLTSWRRRRIVRYAAQLGLSAVEAGRFIDTCRAEVAVPDRIDPTRRYHALRLVKPRPSRVSTPIKIALVIAVALLLDLLVLIWL